MEISFDKEIGGTIYMKKEGLVEECSISILRGKYVGEGITLV